MDKILMVDRFQSFLEALRRRFGSELEILSAGNVGRAREHLEENLDIRLVVICPDTIGWEQVFDFVRGIRKTNSDLTILVLARDSPDAQKLLQAGCNQVAPRFRVSQTISEILSGKMSASSYPSQDAQDAQEAVKILIVIVVGREDDPAVKLHTAIRTVASGMSLAVEIQNSFAVSCEGAVADIKRIRPQIVFLPRYLDNGDGNDVALWIDFNWLEPIKVASYGYNTVEVQRLMYQSRRCVTHFVDTYYEDCARNGVEELFEGLLHPVD
jgi:hypothetical protein